MSIQVGKNARDNDRLTSEMSGQDYWFHASDVPGAHVVMKRGGDMMEAARLAAIHSKAKGPLVKVTMAQGTDVYKPPGAPPGLVICLLKKEIDIRIEWKG